MIQIALDTSVLIGLLDQKDTWHKQAIGLKQALQENDAAFAVFDCVLAEAMSTMARRIQEQHRTGELDQLLTRLSMDYPPGDIVWILPDVPALYADVVELIRSSGGELNFNDSLIAISCRNRTVPLIASFDRDFDRVSWLRRIAQPEDLAEMGETDS